eukprot:g3000.t1
MYTCQKRPCTLECSRTLQRQETNNALLICKLLSPHLEEADGEKHCVLKCEAEGYNPRYCAEKCRDDEEADGEKHCVLKCEAEGYNPRYCAEKCRDDEEADGEKHCVLKCEAEGYNPRYCAEKCRDDEEVSGWWKEAGAIGQQMKRLREEKV